MFEHLNEAFENLKRIAGDLAQQLPPGWPLTKAFTDADDDPDFDVDPGANYHIGYLRGAADVLGRDIDDLLDALGYGEYVAPGEKEASNEP